MNSYLNLIPKFPQLSKEESLECKIFITEKELFETLKSMSNEKSLGNHDLT